MNNSDVQETRAAEICTTNVISKISCLSKQLSFVKEKNVNFVQYLFKKEEHDIRQRRFMGFYTTSGLFSIKYRHEFRFNQSLNFKSYWIVFC